MAIGLLGLLADCASGQQTLYGISSNNRLVAIDRATASATPIGVPFNSGGQFPFGMDFRGGLLYFVAENTSNLYQLDHVTGNNVGLPVPLGAPGVLEGDIAFRSDGIGFMATGLSASFRSFNITVPSSTPIGPGPTPQIDGLAFDAADVLYALSEGGAQLYTVSLATGAVTPIGAGTGVAGGTFGWSGLAFDATGSLYAVVSFGPYTSSNLYTINRATGVATLVGTVSGGHVLLSIRFGPGGAVPGVTGPQGNDEGSYPGSSGPAAGGGEGGFGFGGMELYRAPILKGPTAVGTFLLARNVSHQQRATVQVDPNTESGFGPFGWSLAAVVGVGLIVLIRKMPFA